MEASNNVAVVGNGLTGGTITGGLVAPAPNVCPGCGRCRECGQPYPAPYIPPYQPYYGQPYYTAPQITCESQPNIQSGTVQTAQPGVAYLNTQTNAAQ